MPAIILPTLNTKSMKKPDRGDVFGMLWATKNLDLTRKPGTIHLASRMGVVFDNDDDGDLDTPVAFIRTNADQTDRWWALTQASGISRTDGLLFKTTGTSATSGWAQDTNPGSGDITPIDAVDNMVIFGEASGYDKLIVARDTDLAKMSNGVWDASWWDTTLAQTALSNTHTHHIYVFLNTLLVPDGNVVHTVDDSDVVVTDRITFPDEYDIRWIHDDGVYVYFGTEHIRGGEGLIFYWDGTSETYNGYYKTGSYLTFAGVTDNRGILHTINANGRLLAFNGSGLDEVARFPFEQKFGNWGVYDTLGNIKINAGIRPNGMGILDDKIVMSVKATISDWQTPENFPAGIWEYDKEVGLYMKYAFNKAASPGFGACSVGRVGALKVYNDYATGQRKQRFIVGAKVYEDHNAQITAILVSDQSSSQQGYFITSRVENGTDFRALWTRLHIAFRKFTGSSHSIIIKYRTDRSSDFAEDTYKDVFTATWSNTTTFAIDDSDGAKLSVGDEVEVIVGKGEGYIAHISSITNTSGDAYTIVVDEAVSVSASDTSKVRIQNWTKLGTIKNQTEEKALMTIIKRSKWIQLKVQLGGTNVSPALEELFLEFNPSRR